jgi:hypothetical protein
LPLATLDTNQKKLQLKIRHFKKQKLIGKFMRISNRFLEKLNHGIMSNKDLWMFSLPYTTQSREKGAKELI